MQTLREDVVGPDVAEVQQVPRASSGQSILGIPRLIFVASASFYLLAQQAANLDAQVVTSPNPSKTAAGGSPPKLKEKVDWGRWKSKEAMLSPFGIKSYSLSPEEIEVLEFLKAHPDTARTMIPEIAGLMEYRVWNTEGARMILEILENVGEDGRPALRAFMMRRGYSFFGSWNEIVNERFSKLPPPTERDVEALCADWKIPCRTWTRMPFDAYRDQFQRAGRKGKAAVQILQEELTKSITTEAFHEPGTQLPMHHTSASSIAVTLGTVADSSIIPQCGKTLAEAGDDPRSHLRRSTALTQLQHLEPCREMSDLFPILQKFAGTTCPERSDARAVIVRMLDVPALDNETIPYMLEQLNSHPSNVPVYRDKLFRVFNRVVPYCWDAVYNEDEKRSKAANYFLMTMAKDKSPVLLGKEGQDFLERAKDATRHPSLLWQAANEAPRGSAQRKKGVDWMKEATQDKSLGRARHALTELIDVDEDDDATIRAFLGRKDFTADISEWIHVIRPLWIHRRPAYERWRDDLLKENRLPWHTFTTAISGIRSSAATEELRTLRKRCEDPHQQKRIDEMIEWHEGKLREPK